MSSWAAGALKALFGMGISSQQAADMKALMEASFGEIKIDAQEKGGRARAFFATQTLIGDANARTRICHKHPIISLNMAEPIGYGRNSDAAIADLLKKMTGPRASESILQTGQYMPYGIAPHTEYKRFSLQNGQFVYQGIIPSDLPPARAENIEKFLAFERHIASIRSNPDPVGHAIPALLKT